MNSWNASSEALAAAHRAKVMAALPKEGELRPRANETGKLDAAQKILVYHRP